MASLSSQEVRQDDQKTLYLCVMQLVASALMSINACSSNVQANTNESELERIAHERELEAEREQKSVWETDLADESLDLL